MRRRAFIIAMVLAAAARAMPAFAAGDDTSIAPPISCGNGIPGGVNCIVSKKELKDARKAYDKGVKFQEHQRPEEAFARFDEAARLAPQNLQFLTAREIVKAQLVFNHVQRGNLLLLENARARAAAEFRTALDLDPDYEFARERLAEAVREMAPELPRALPVHLADSGEIHLETGSERATFHFSGDVRDLFAELSAAYGVTPQFDDSVLARQVRFNVDDVDFSTALKLACQVSKTMWADSAPSSYLSPPTTRRTTGNSTACRCGPLSCRRTHRRRRPLSW
jgi:tetratricopeptide (TPR) repeat protein